MPLRRFAAYFLGISVCSTVALASGVPGRSVSQGTVAPSADSPAAVRPDAPAAPRHRDSHKPLVVASVD